MTLQRLPSIIESQKKKIARLEDELPVLREIISRSWGKTDELAKLKAECEALRRKIDDELKQAELPHEDNTAVKAA